QNDRHWYESSANDALERTLTRAKSPVSGCERIRCNDHTKSAFADWLARVRVGAWSATGRGQPGNAPAPPKRT
ncbi:hypothetical protein, partial [Longimicrobium sp.]|uniref:hypothetical protein n=1 Tax=Longimicrobium sp. TaxID=2029185 RepID=UPI002EDB8C93